MLAPKVVTMKRLKKVKGYVKQYWKMPESAELFWVGLCLSNYSQVRFIT